MSILPPKHSAIRVRLTQADRDVLVSRAQRSGVALSVIIRRAIREYLNKPEPQFPSHAPAIRELNKTWLPKSSDGRGGA